MLRINSNFFLNKKQNLNLIVILFIFTIPIHTIEIIEGENPDFDLISEFMENRKDTIKPGNADTWTSKFNSAMGSFTKDEERCIEVRNYLSMLPSVATSDSFSDYIKSFLQSEKLENFRKAAYQILKDSENYENAPIIKNAKGIISQLFQLKELFYDMEYLDPFKQNEKDPKIIKYEEDLKIAEKELDEAKEKLNSLRIEMDKRTEYIEDIINKLKQPSNRVNIASENIKKYERLEGLVQDLESLLIYVDNEGISEFENINDSLGQDVLILIKEMKYTDRLETMQKILQTIQYNLSSAKNRFFDKFLVELDKMLTKIDPIVLNKTEKISTSQTNITNIIREKIDKTFQEISEDKNLLNYQEEIAKKIENENKVNNYISDVIYKQQEMSKLQLRVASLSQEEKHNYVLSRKLVSENNLRLMEEERFKQILNNLQPNTCAKDATEEEQVLIEASNMAKQMQNFFEKKNQIIAERAFRMNQINDLESQIDKALGYFFGSIYELNSGLKCFLNSELSFFFFNMFKTNFVVDEISFMKSFLETIRPAYARSFIVLNYVIFTNDEYVDDIVKKNKQNIIASVSKSPLKKMIRNFSMQFSVMINLFKNYTQSYSDAVEKNVENGTYLTSFFFFLRQILNQIKDFLKECSVTFLMSMIADIILEFIPFVNSFSLLKVVMVKLLCKIFGLIEKLLYSIWGYNKKKIDAIVQGAREMISGKRREDYVVDLNYKAVVKKKKKKEAAVDAKIQFKNIESLYLKYYRENSSMIKAESVNLFVPEYFLVEEDTKLYLDQREEQEVEDYSEVNEDAVLV
jgi:hypothetical protein